ncbi:zinc-dependent metalloprotease [Pseudoalteromonas tunicata]|uniref:zinc-dependent metalloprotease n=1 Tax=Pseudoalteromonas tunicata TaxID=314281 RepID=UPI0027402A5C|nr:zinc-dependent metalloprotease [Pseudoalteromonas tunicata]MDP4983736.1 zinc-dependent metalloprotease [Pseudoalteromonas tunicata]
MLRNRSFLFITLSLLLGIVTQAHAALKSIDEFTHDMNQYPGYFPFYYDDNSGKLYLEVEKLNQAFLLQQSLPYGLGSNDIGLDRGQLGETRLVQFEKMGNKLMLRQLNTYYRANTSNKAEQQSVKEAFASSILFGFELAANTEKSYLIDYTPYLLSDVHGVSRTLEARKQGSFSLDSSRSAVFMPRSKAFAKNTELEAVLTFKGSKPGEFVRQVSADPYAISVNMHHSLIELPDDNYQPRAFHPQSGFWSVEHKDYAAPLGQSMLVRYIPRHRLAKKDPSAAVSEAVEPIVYYLDPGVPEPVRTALLDGAKWWDQAFAAAGYKNAFQVKVLPEHADPMDIRYNVIQWVHRATRGWSYGASVIDPRTGEIIKGHVTLGSLRVRQDILIAEALAAPFVKGNEVNDALQAMALDRIRQLSAHEIGHTLGIAHNFSASIKDRASVMDYPHPLVSFNDDGSFNTSQGYAKGMGVWDTQVIKYGYADVAKEQEQNHLAAVLEQNKQLGLEFISDDDARAQGGAHPTAHLWDNGAEPVAELERILNIREKALAQFGIQNIKTGTALSQLEEVLVPLYLLHRYQVEAAVKLIAGVDYHYEVRNQDAPAGTQMVSVEQQKAALATLMQTLEPSRLTIPESVLALIPPKAYGEAKTRESIVGRTGLTLDAMALPEVAAQHSLNLLLNSQRLNRLQQQKMRDSQQLGVRDVIFPLSEQVFFADTNTGAAAKIQQRVQVLTASLMAKQSISAAVAPEVQAELTSQLKFIAKKYQRSSDVFSQYLADEISFFLSNGEWSKRFNALPMPPGSPI